MYISIYISMDMAAACASFPHHSSRFLVLLRTEVCILKLCSKSALFFLSRICRPSLKSWKSGIPGNLSKPINVRPWMKSANASKHSSFILMVLHSLAARSICNARFPRSFPNERSTRGELARNWAVLLRLILCVCICASEPHGISRIF